MSETIQEMENRWTGLMAARYGTGHRQAGERIYEVDGKYAREVTALGVQIAERKAAEGPQGVQINREQLIWLERAQGAMSIEKRDPKNPEIVLEPSRRLTEVNPKYARNLAAARTKVFEGGDISGMTVSALAEQELQATMPTLTPRPTGQHRDRDNNLIGDVRLVPSAIDLTPALPQAISTGRDRQA